MQTHLKPSSLRRVEIIILKSLSKKKHEFLSELEDEYALTDDKHYDPPKDLDTLIYEYSMKHPDNSLKEFLHTMKVVVCLILN